MYNSTTKNSPELHAFFLKGEEIVVEGNTHFILDDPAALYWMEEEEGDLFMFLPQDKSFIPQFLVDVAPFDLLLPAPVVKEAKGYSLFFVSSRRARLRKISLQMVREEIQRSDASAKAISALLDKWGLHLISYFVSPPEGESVDYYFQVKEKVEAKEGTKLALMRTLAPEEKNHVVWLQIKKGSATLSGESLYTFSAEKNLLFPLSFFHSLHVQNDLEMESAFTYDYLKSAFDLFFSSIAYFYLRVFDRLSEKRAKGLEEAVEKMQKKKRLEEERYQEAFYKLGSVLNEKITIPSSHEGTPLFKACDLVCQDLKIQIYMPPLSEGDDEDKQVRQIATHNEIYLRKTTLGPEWWKRSSGPILAFWQGGGAVALLPRKNGYEVIDPNTQTHVPLAVALPSLSDKAYVFYEGFPKKVLYFTSFIKGCYKYNLKDFLLIFAVALLGGLLNLFLPFAMKTLFDTLSFGKDLNLLSQLTMGLLIITFSSSLFLLVKNFTVQRIQGIAKNQLETSLWARLLDLPASFFRKNPSGNLMSYASTLQGMRADIVSNVTKLVLDGAYCFFYLLLMIFYSWQLAFLGIGGIFLAALIYAVCITIQVRLTSKVVDLSSRIQGVVVQIITGIAKIRVAGAESRFFGIWGHLFAEKKRLSIKIKYASAVQSLVFRLFPLLLTATLFSVAIALFKGGFSYNLAQQTSGLSMGTFLGFATAFNLFIAAALEILETLFAQSLALPYWDKAKFILQEPLEKPQERLQTAKLKGAVALEQISFRYSKEEEWILQDISMVANPGEMIGIVGPSGSGKSTLVRLLLGFETPEQGEVLYDELALQDLDLRSVRKQIGTVLQNAGILAGSLFENIVGAGTYTVEEIERALFLSGFEEDLRKLPMGLNTILPMGGSTLSGGQRQRLYLARALVSSPKILILDEATSALDNKTQELVSANLDSINVTRIVIAHRLSTIQHADRIYVLEKGRIVESGTFQELAAQKGLFADMLKRQSIG